MRAIDELMGEHRAIERMLSVLGSIATRLERNEAVSAEDLQEILEFLQVFADGCHHAKEEDLLFPAMEQAGMPRNQGPIGVMLDEHVVGRGYVRAMARAVEAYAQGEAAAGREIARNANGYVALLSGHIQKEDQILYPLARRMLSEQEDRRLLNDFRLVENGRVGPGRHEAFHELLDRLSASYLGD